MNMGVPPISGPQGSNGINFNEPENPTPSSILPARLSSIPSGDDEPEKKAFALQGMVDAAKQDEEQRL